MYCKARYAALCEERLWHEYMADGARALNDAVSRQFGGMLLAPWREVVIPKKIEVRTADEIKADIERKLKAIGE